MAAAPPPDILLDPLQGDPRAAEEWVTTFHLAMVILDPFTIESSWIIDSAARILGGFRGADVRIAFMVTGTDDQAKQFLGPFVDEFLTFSDPDRAFVKGLELERLPAFVHLDHSLNVLGAAEGWRPGEWRDVAAGLADLMHWSRPHIPDLGDPVPYEGSPAL